MILITGLDFRHPIRAVRLKALPENRFSVVYCTVKDTLDQFSTLDTAAPIAIALPDAQILHQTVPPDKNKAEIAWDFHHGEYREISKKKLNNILTYFRQHPISICAVDIESEAMARALQIICHISHKYFAILYNHPAKTQLSVSIFENQRKIFFHQENVQENWEIIITRAFRVFNLRFPDIQIPFEARYVIGEQPELSKYGVIPALSQYLQFESEADQHLFQKENTQWLLACGLSLWEKKSGWNLLPWRQQETQQYKKTLLKNSLKILFYSTCLVFLCHVILLFMLHLQTKKNILLDQKIEKLYSKALTITHLQNETHKLKSESIAWKQLLSYPVLPIPYLEKLSNMIPSGIFLNTLSFNSPKISITGRAETETQVNKLFSLLKPNAVLENMSQNASNIAYPIDFTMTVNIDNHLKRESFL